MKRAASSHNKLHTSQAQEVRILRKIVEITHSGLDLNLILNDAVKLVTDFTRADSVFIYLFDEKKQNLILRASKTPHRKELGHVALKQGEGITGWVAQESKPVAISKNASRQAAFLDILGYYDPAKKPASLSVNLDKINSWVNKGAQLSDTVKSLVKRSKKS